MSTAHGGLADLLHHLKDDGDIDSFNATGHGHDEFHVVVNEEGFTLAPDEEADSILLLSLAKTKQVPGTKDQILNMIERVKREMPEGVKFQSMPWTGDVEVREYATFTDYVLRTRIPVETRKLTQMDRERRSCVIQETINLLQRANAISRAVLQGPTK